MIKQCATVALMAMTGLTGPWAWAAREQHTFEVSLTVPSRAFYLVPTEPGWIHQQQRLDWDFATSTLSNVRKYFDVRHDSSAIQARLEIPPLLSNGKPDEDIELQVRFNGVLLSTAPRPQQVVSAAEAAIGARVLLEIDPLKPAGGYRPGEYRGNVLLMFNAQSPGV